MELDFDKYCIIDRSPTTVLPVPRRKSNRKSIKEEFSDISFNRYRSASCRDTRSRKSHQEHNEVLKRGSVYQSSKEVRLLKNTDPIVERKKIELSRERASALSFGIIDSLCTLDEEDSASEVRSSVISLSEESTSSACKYEIQTGACKNVNRAFPPIPKRTIAPNRCSLDKSRNQEREVAFNLHKSLSAKLSLPHSPSHSESNSLQTSSPISRFNPIKKRFDPFVKSKSERSPLSSANEDEEKTKNHKSMLDNLLEKPHHGKCEKKENQTSMGQHSSVHLHAFLKLENRHGLPYFEFSVDSPEDLYIVKTWKVENVLSWVYTFHSVHQRRKSSSSTWGFKESSRETFVLGQMNVSCYPCMELKGGGTLDESVVTEFVLYDISHLRKCTSIQESSPNDKGSDDNRSWDTCERSENSPKTKIKGQSRNTRDFGYIGSLPMTSTELHPELGSAAIVMQLPFEKRESLKHKDSDKSKSFSNFHDILQQVEVFSDDTPSSGKMHVVVPAGNHSLPNSGSCGPSSLIDRWRMGGGCDCGGWDMACPLDVFENPNIQIVEGHPLMDHQHPVHLFARGKKESSPAAFTMRRVEDGKYSVDFHAQLSSLQALSICVAIVHASESWNAVGHERSKQMIRSESLKVFPEEQIVSLMEAIGEEKRAVNKKKIEESLRSFDINPPFSPIARV